MTINRVLTQNTVEEIHHVLVVTPTSRYYTTLKISQPAVPITMKCLHKLQGLIHSGQDQNSFSRTLFHHLHITALSPLVPRDRSLHITINNILYALTPVGTTHIATPHRLHLLLNPHTHLPYLQHIHEVDEKNTYRLVIITSLPSKRSRSRRHPMMRTITYSPDPVTKLTFPADSTQHQLSIMTLATHLLLSIPCLK